MLTITQAHQLFINLIHTLNSGRELRQAEAGLPGGSAKERKRHLNDLVKRLHFGFDPESEHPLLALQALDVFIYESAGGRDDPPPARLKSGDTSYWLVRRPFPSRCRSALARHPGHLQSWLRYHWAVPVEISGFRVQVSPSSGKAWEALNGLLQQEYANLHIGSFADGVEPRWLREHEPDFLAEELTDSESRAKSMEANLREAAERGAHLLVFPELTLTPALRRHCIRWLMDNPDHGFALVLPGSFHQRQGDGWINRAELFDANGDLLLHHHKLQASGNMQQAGGPDWCEKIAPGDGIRLLNTPLGLLAMPICLDFCQAGMVFAGLWETLGIEWALVPAFGNAASMRAHARRARELARAHGTRTLLANQPYPAGCQAPGFIHPGGREAEITQIEATHLVSIWKMNDNEQ